MLCVCVCVSRYTREAGVRSLERKIGALCRAVAVKVAEGQKVTEPAHGGLDGSAQEARGQCPRGKIKRQALVGKDVEI